VCTCLCDPSLAHMHAHHSVTARCPQRTRRQCTCSRHSVTSLTCSAHWANAIVCLPPLPAVLQIARRRRAHQEAHPDAQIISLGIGDTTEPLPQFIADAMAKAAAGLATREGYSG
jgi:hypothetical protein